MVKKYTFEVMHPREGHVIEEIETSKKAKEVFDRIMGVGLAIFDAETMTQKVKFDPSVREYVALAPIAGG